MTNTNVNLCAIRAGKNCGPLFRSKSVPLVLKRDFSHDDYLIIDGVLGGQADSCVLSAKRKLEIRGRNARNEFILAKGVKYSRDAGPDRKRIALVMLLRAAKNGSASALEELSDCYRRGIGTCIDEVAAQELLKAFLRRSVEKKFLEELLDRTYKKDQAEREQNPKTKAKAGNKIWFYRYSKKSGRARKTSQRMFCFLPEVRNE